MQIENAEQILKEEVIERLEICQEFVEMFKMTESEREQSME